MRGRCAKPRASLLPPAPNTPTSFLSLAPLRAFPTRACCLSQESQGAPTLVHALVWVCTHIHTCAPAHTSFSPLLLLLNPTHPPVCHQGPGHGHPPAWGLYISWKKAGGAEWIWGPTGVTAKGPQQRVRETERSGHSLGPAQAAVSQVSPGHLAGISKWCLVGHGGLWGTVPASPDQRTPSRPEVHSSGLHTPWPRHLI